MFPNLYKKTSKGKIQQWKVWTEGSTICTEHGQLEGKKQLDRKEATPKNVGRSNETTGSEQALLEAGSLLSKKEKKGYKRSVEDTESQVFLPMLATSFEKVSKTKFPCDLQPKLNGVRCLARWVGEEVKLFSRGGEIYDVAHLSTALSTILPRGKVLDGEIYIHGTRLQRINALVKKPREVGDEDFPEGSMSLEFHAYDYFDLNNLTESSKERQDNLLLLGEIFTDLVVEPVETKHCQDEAHAYKLLEEYLALGYEGVILRMHEGIYKLGFRSIDLLKLKPFEDKEFKVVGHRMGKGRAKNCPTFICIQEEGKKFAVVPMGTIREREAMGRVAESFYGELLTVRFWDRSRDNIPTGNTVGVAFRLKEDLPREE